MFTSWFSFGAEPRLYIKVSHVLAQVTSFGAKVALQYRGPTDTSANHEVSRRFYSN